MNKAEFLSSLRSALSALPAEDVQKSIDYYSEMIDDRIEDGMSEDEAVSEMGDPGKVANDIIAETPLKTIVKEKIRKRRAPSAGTVVLLILGSPIWLPLLIVAAIMLLSFFIVLWALVVIVFVVALALAAASVGVIILAFKLLFSGQGSMALPAFGASLALAGSAILMFLAARLFAIIVFKLCRAILRSIKIIFTGKEK